MHTKQIDIYSSISQDILNQRYPPNTRLKERDLAIKYNTSRTTIRQTLQKLANENKIIINPRSKTLVKKINLEKIQQSFLLRECLELTVASIILKKIKKNNLYFLEKNINNQKKLLINYNKSKNKKYIILDNQFHSYLFKVANLEAFWLMVTDYNFDFDRLRHISAFSTKRSNESTNEHKKIYNALKEKNIKKLKISIKEHFFNSKKYYKKLLLTHKAIIE